MHRWAQIREAFLASQWQLGAGRRGACAGGSAAAAEEAAPGLAGAGGGGGAAPPVLGGGGGSPRSPSRACRQGLLPAGAPGLFGGPAGAGSTPPTLVPPVPLQGLSGAGGVAPLPLIALPTPSGTFFRP